MLRLLCGIPVRFLFSSPVVSLLKMLPTNVSAQIYKQSPLSSGQTLAEESAPSQEEEGGWKREVRSERGDVVIDMEVTVLRKVRR